MQSPRIWEMILHTRQHHLLGVLISYGCPSPDLSKEHNTGSMSTHETEDYDGQETQLITWCIETAKCGKGNKRSEVLKQVQNVAISCASTAVNQSGNKIKKTERAEDANMATVQQCTVLWRRLKPIILDMGGSWPAFVTEAALQQTTLSGK